MKKTLLIMVMALAVLLTQCRKPEVKFPSPVAPEGTTVSMTVTAGPGSKTDISETGGITWSTGDKLYVGDGTKYIGYLTIVSGMGTPTGTFSGYVTLTGIPEGTTHTFGFYYLGSAERTLTVGATEATVSFATQEIYNNGGNLENASAQHVGYGTASGTVKDGVVTGINVTLVSKVALARFSFKKDDGTYCTDELTLSGDKIYSSMTVGFNGSFNHGATAGNISLTGSHSERYVMLVPTGDATEQTLTFACGPKVGGGKVPGLQSNKFYGKSDAIAVSLHEYVDLGLSVKWAKCNLGASKPEDYGDYYAWGEIEPYYADGHSQDNPCDTWRSMKTGAGNTVLTSGYAWQSYSQGGTSDFTEWTQVPYSGTTLTSDYDAATQNWGGGWRMPTYAEFNELKSNTTRTWYDAGNTEFNGVAGWKCANKSDATKYIFLPAAGYRNGTTLDFAVSFGFIWSRSLGAYGAQSGRALGFTTDTFRVDDLPRHRGYTLRPVSQPQN